MNVFLVDVRNVPNNIAKNVQLAAISEYDGFKKFGLKNKLQVGEMSIQELKGSLNQIDNSVLIFSNVTKGSLSIVKEISSNNNTVVYWDLGDGRDSYALLDSGFDYIYQSKSVKGLYDLIMNVLPPKNPFMDIVPNIIYLNKSNEKVVTSKVEDEFNYNSFISSELLFQHMFRSTEKASSELNWNEGQTPKEIIKLGEQYEVDQLVIKADCKVPSDSFILLAHYFLLHSELAKMNWFTKLFASSKKRELQEVHENIKKRKR